MRSQSRERGVRAGKCPRTEIWGSREGTAAAEGKKWRENFVGAPRCIRAVEGVYMRGRAAAAARERGREFGVELDAAAAAANHVDTTRQQDAANSCTPSDCAPVHRGLFH